MSTAVRPGPNRPRMSSSAEESGARPGPELERGEGDGSPYRSEAPLTVGWRRPGDRRGTSVTVRPRSGPGGRGLAGRRRCPGRRRRPESPRTGLGLGPGRRHTPGLAGVLGCDSGRSAGEPVTARRWQHGHAAADDVTSRNARQPDGPSRAELAERDGRCGTGRGDRATGHAAGASGPRRVPRSRKADARVRPPPRRSAGTAGLHRRPPPRDQGAMQPVNRPRVAAPSPASCAADVHRLALVGPLVHRARSPS